MHTNIPFYRDFENARRSVYLSSAQISCALETYLDLTDEEFRDRVKKKMSASFENELKAFCCVRDAIVLSTFADTFSDKEQVREYANHLVDLEEDYDLRELRVSVLHKIASLH